MVPMRRLLKEILDTVDPDCAKDPSKLASVIWEDNNGAISTVNSPKMTPCTKHIAVKYHYTREHVREDKGVLLKKIDTKIQKADILTKGLVQEDFEHLRHLLCGW